MKLLPYSPKPDTWLHSGGESPLSVELTGMKLLERASTCGLLVRWSQEKDSILRPLGYEADKASIHHCWILSLDLVQKSRAGQLQSSLTFTPDQICPGRSIQHNDA